MRKRRDSPLAGIDTRWSSVDADAAIGRRPSDGPCCSHFVGESSTVTPIAHRSEHLDVIPAPVPNRSPQPSLILVPDVVVR